MYRPRQDSRMYRTIEYINSMGGKFTRKSLVKFFKIEKVTDKVDRKIEDTIAELKRNNVIDKLKTGYKLKEEYLTIAKKYYIITDIDNDEVFRCDDLIETFHKANKLCRLDGSFYEIYEVVGTKKVLLAKYDNKFKNYDSAYYFGGAA